MGLLLPPESEVYQVQHLPIVPASADTIGLGEGINQLGSSEMAIDPGTMVLGRLLDTLRGRSPLSRVEEGFAQQDTARLLGKAVAPEACHDDPVGRVLDRLDEIGTLTLFTACAVRADQVGGWDKRSVHCETTSVSVSGASLPPVDPQDPQQQAGPLTMTQG